MDGNLKINDRFPADWAAKPPLSCLFDLLSTGDDRLWLVGGAVRDRLLGLAVSDYDFATTMAPEAVMARAAQAGIRAIDTGLSHGTVTLVISGSAFQITSLREDIETDGRRAKTRFGRDWRTDAARRDFTINALYCNRDGVVYDAHNGLEDLKRGIVRFIGDPAQRIKEDYLRILRYFRFAARFGRQAPDIAALDAIRQNREGLSRLSAERVTQELRLLLGGPNAASAIAQMEQLGVLALLISRPASGEILQKLRDLDPISPRSCQFVLTLAALFSDETISEGEIQRRLRLTKAETRQLMAVSPLATYLHGQLPEMRDEEHAHFLRDMLQCHGRERLTDALLLLAARHGWAPSHKRWRQWYAQAASLPIPQFPLSGRDLIAAGVPAGPAVSQAVAKAREIWRKSDFSLDSAELLKRMMEKG